MKITRRQLREIILESLLEQDATEEDEQPVEKPDVNLEIGLGGDSQVSLNLRIDKNGKTEAYVKDDETGSIIEKYDDASDEKIRQDLFGWLRVGLEDAKDKVSKMAISNAISRITGRSEKKEDEVANLENDLADRNFATYAQNVRSEKKFLSTKPGSEVA